MNHWLENAIDFVKFINPNLLPSSPPAIEITGSDVCFLGPSGKIDEQDVVFCRDLPDGKRAIVASWYLTPERHLYEFVIGTFISLIIMKFLINDLQYPKRTITNPTKSNAIRPPYILRVISAISMVLMIIYKSVGYEGKIFFVLMPCNVNWIMTFVLSYYPYLTLKTSYFLCQLLIPLMALAFVALAEPDLGDLKLPFEIPYFFLSHALLPIYPIYFVSMGNITTLPFPGSTKTYIGNFVGWWLFSCTAFLFFYFTIVSPLALYTGMNLNYMTNPPNGADDMGVSGQNYRILSTGIVAFAFFIISAFVTIMEGAVRFVTKTSFKLKLN